MPIFGANLQTNAVSTSAVAVFNPNAAPYHQGGSIPDFVGPLKDVTFENTGAVTVFLGSSAVTAATGLQLLPGQQLTYNGFSTPVGASGTALYAITSAGSSTVVCGLATTNIND